MPVPRKNPRLTRPDDEDDPPGLVFRSGRSHLAARRRGPRAGKGASRGGERPFVMVHYRRMVAEALALLEADAAVANALPIDRVAEAAADADAEEAGTAAGGDEDDSRLHADDDDDARRRLESFAGSTSQEVGARVRATRGADEPSLNVDDWYARVRAALRGMARDGHVEMVTFNRWRLACDVASVTWIVSLKWDGRGGAGTMPLEISTACTNTRLEEIVRRRTPGALAGRVVRCFMDVTNDAENHPSGAPKGARVAFHDAPPDTQLSALGVDDGAEIEIDIEQRVGVGGGGGATPLPGRSGSAIDDDDDEDEDENEEDEVAAADADDADDGDSETESDDDEEEELDPHEIVEREAEGAGGWNDSGDGWVNLTRSDEDDDSDSDSDDDSDVETILRNPKSQTEADALLSPPPTIRRPPDATAIAPSPSVQDLTLTTPVSRKGEFAALVDEDLDEVRRVEKESDESDSGTFVFTLAPIRPRSRGERRFLRTFPGASLRSPLAFNPRPYDAFQPRPTPFDSTPTVDFQR